MLCFMFITAFSFGIVNSTYADPPAGELCVNGGVDMCIWYNNDGSIDFWVWGTWYHEFE